MLEHIKLPDTLTVLDYERTGSGISFFFLLVTVLHLNFFFCYETLNANKTFIIVILGNKYFTTHQEKFSAGKPITLLVRYKTKRAQIESRLLFNKHEYVRACLAIFVCSGCKFSSLNKTSYIELSKIDYKLRRGWLKCVDQGNLIVIDCFVRYNWIKYLPLIFKVAHGFVILCTHMEAKLITIR